MFIYISVFYSVILNHSQTNMTKYALQGIFPQQEIGVICLDWGGAGRRGFHKKTRRKVESE